MSQTLARIRALAATGDLRISEHGYDELASDQLTAREVVEGLNAAIVVEDYPAFYKGPSVLLLQRDLAGGPVHVVWGIPRGNDRPAVLITAYRPDALRWDSSFTVRKK